ncbi:MAG TPA: hypothetical protein VD866_24610 [Urbifossiella sp.]|nr:hypothetical protein [Urbifossiella sp.]
MDEFEHDFLRLAAAGYAPDDLFFSSGPATVTEPEFSHCVSGIVEYPAEAVATAVAALPGFVSVEDGEYSRAWRWEQGARWVEVVVDADNTDDGGVWLASVVRADCTFDDLVTVWEQLRRSIPAVYLHEPTCRMLTPRSFLEEIAVAALAPAMASPDPPTARRAASEFARYRKLAGAEYCRRGSWPERVPGSTRSVFDLRPPVARLRCVNRWRGRDWEPREGEFDRTAAAHGLRYWAHPTSWTVGEKYRSGFVVWCPLGDLVTARGVAAELGMLADDPEPPAA